MSSHGERGNSRWRNRRMPERGKIVCLLGIRRNSVLSLHCDSPFLHEMVWPGFAHRKWVELAHWPAGLVRDGVPFQSIPLSGRSLPLPRAQTLCSCPTVGRAKESLRAFYEKLPMDPGVSPGLSSDLFCSLPGELRLPDGLAPLLLPLREPYSVLPERGTHFLPLALHDGAEPVPNEPYPAEVEV